MSEHTYVRHLEQALAEAERKLGRIRQMADAWDSTWGNEGIRADVVAEALRETMGDKR